MPKAANVFAFLFVQGTQAHRLLNAYNLPWLPLGVLGTYVLTRELGASRRTALLAGALFILTPVIITLGPTAYVDGATAAVFAAWLGLLAVTYGRFARGQVPWGLAPAVAAAAGLTIGVKITGAVLGAMGLAMYLPGMLAGLRQGTGPARRFAFAALGWLGVVIAGMLLAGGYWYARNYARNGNPVYPIEVAAADRVIFPGQAPSAMLRPGSGEAEGTVAWSQASRVAYSWLQGLDRWPVSIRSHDSKEGGLGYAWLLAGLPGILTFAVATASRAALPPGRRPLREIPLTTVFLPLLLVVAVTFVLRPWNHWPRHTVWLVALGLPCWAVLVERLFRAGTPGPRRAGRAWLAAVLAIALFEAGYAFAWTATRCYVRHPTWPGFRENPVVAARSLTWYDPVGYMQPDLAGGPFEAVFAGSAPVAVGSFEAELLLLVGRLSQPIGARPIHFIDWDTAADRSHLEAYVRERHIRYLIWSTVYPYPDTLDRVAVRHARAGQWFHVFEFARQTPDATGAEPDD
jgi:4-amino-4-deoxy-L-arabinose transferase-like glycosyltransferase